jgi:hypothetical protein
MNNQKTVSEELVNSKIKNENYFSTNKTTICVLALENGFEVVGTSAVVDIEFFDKELGEKYAKQKALDKVWELEAYILQNQI